MVKRDNDSIVLLGCDLKLNESIIFEDNMDYLWVGKALKSLIEKNPNYMNLFNKTNNLFAIEIHNLDRMNKRYPEYVSWIKNDAPKNVGFLMQEEFAIKFNSLIFPRNEIKATFAYKNYKSSFAWMVAYALYKGYRRIYIYGVQMVFSDDYCQKPNFEAWLTYAMAHRVKIITTPESGLLQPYLDYGYEVDNTEGVARQKAILELQDEIKDLLLSCDDTETAKQLLTKFETLFKDHRAFLKEIYARHGLAPEVSGKSFWDDTND